jgi:hypothetical protein
MSPPANARLTALGKRWCRNSTASLSPKRVDHAAQRKAARQLYADTLEVLRLGIAQDDADEFKAR